MSEESKIVVSDSSIKIQNLEITRKEVADYLRLVKEDERVQAFVKAVEVGVFCLERAAASQDTEFVRRQVESLLNDVEAKVREIPRKTEEALVGKIGTEKNQVLAPVKTLIENVEKTARERIEAVRELLQQDIARRFPTPWLPRWKPVPPHAGSTSAARRPGLRRRSANGSKAKSVAARGLPARLACYRSPFVLR